MALDITTTTTTKQHETTGTTVATGTPVVVLLQPAGQRTDREHNIYPDTDRIAPITAPNATPHSRPARQAHGPTHTFKETHTPHRRSDAHTRQTHTTPPPPHHTTPHQTHRRPIKRTASRDTTQPRRDQPADQTSRPAAETNPYRERRPHSPNDTSQTRASGRTTRARSLHPNRNYNTHDHIATPLTSNPPFLYMWGKAVVSSLRESLKGAIWFIRPCVVSSARQASRQGTKVFGGASDCVSSLNVSVASGLCSTGYGAKAFP